MYVVQLVYLAPISEKGITPLTGLAIFLTTPFHHPIDCDTTHPVSFLPPTAAALSMSGISLAPLKPLNNSGGLVQTQAVFGEPGVQINKTVVVAATNVRCHAAQWGSLSHPKYPNTGLFRISSVFLCLYRLLPFSSLPSLHLPSRPLFVGLRFGQG